MTNPAGRPVRARRRISRPVAIDMSSSTTASAQAEPAGLAVGGGDVVDVGERRGGGHAADGEQDEHLHDTSRPADRGVRVVVIGHHPAGPSSLAA